MLSGCATRSYRTGEYEALQRAEHSLKAGRKPHYSAEVRAGHYLDAAAASAPLLDETALDGRQIHNEATAELTTLLRDHRELWQPSVRIPSPSGNGVYLLSHAPGRAVANRPGKKHDALWDPAYFSSFKPAWKVSTRTFRQTFRQEGVGGSLVGVRERTSFDRKKEPFVLRAGVSAPVTALLEFSPARTSQAERPVLLSLHDPARPAAPAKKKASSERQLAADFTAPFAYYPRRSEFWTGLFSMLQVEKYISNTGLYMLQPYDPERLPVIFIHGLASTPMMWNNVINEIEGDPELRGRCQYWVLSYPSGIPVSYSALELREDLATIRARYPMPHGMVLVGHSMGGLVSRMQTANTKRALWDHNFRDRAESLYEKVPNDNLLKRALIFEANPDVRRLVFICVPHRGSELATGRLGQLATRLITLPLTLVNTIQSSVGDSLQWLVGNRKDHWPTSIESLSPKNPSLIALNQLPIEAPYHSVIGDRGRGDTPNSSDGVVPYWSSHLEGAESELIVPGPHGSYQLPETVTEVRRILKFQLANPGPPAPRGKRWVEKPPRHGKRQLKPVASQPVPSR